jgi:hypothetical protein
MGSSRVVFSRVPDIGTAALHVELPGIPMSFRKQPATTDPRMWGKGALGALGIAPAAAAVRRRRGPCGGTDMTIATASELWRMAQRSYREDLCLDAAGAIEDRLGIITPIDPR